MTNKQIFYVKIILAQVSAFFIASFLTSKVFLGPIPVVQAEFKHTIVELPQTIVVTIKDLPNILKKVPDTVMKRKQDSQIPPPWIFKPLPTSVLEPIPTSIKTLPTNSPASNLTPTPTPRLRLPKIPRWNTPTPTLPSNNPVPTRQTQPQPTRSSQPPPPSQGESTPEDEILALINQRRKQDGLRELTMNANLRAAARKHSQDMNTKKFCGHGGSDGSDPFKRAEDAGYGGRTYGETVSCLARSPLQAVNGWWNSPPHHAILTNSQIQVIGIGWVGSYQTAVVGY